MQNVGRGAAKAKIILVNILIRVCKCKHVILLYWRFLVEVKCLLLVFHLSFQPKRVCPDVDAKSSGILMHVSEFKI